MQTNFSAPKLHKFYRYVMPLLLLTAPVAGLKAQSGFSGSLITNLYAIVNNSPRLSDGNMVMYDNSFSNDVDAMDVRKAMNFGENFGLKRNNVVLAIERRQLPGETDTVHYFMSNLNTISYRIEIVPSGLADPNRIAVLQDAYLNSQTTVSLSDTTRYAFTVTSDPASKANNRFRVLFIGVAGGPLPVRFTAFSAMNTVGTMQLKWTTAEEILGSAYQVEYSSNGSSFRAIGDLVAANRSHQYQTTVPLTGSGLYYFRILCREPDGRTYYSSIIRMHTESGSGTSVQLLSATGGQVRVQLSNAAAGVYSYRIFSGNGQQLKQGALNHPGGTSVHAVASQYSGSIQILNLYDSKNMLTGSFQFLPR